MIDAQGNYVPDAVPTTAPIVQTTIPVPTPAQIYSAENIQSAAMSPVTAPDLSNASSIYDFYMNGSGVSAARTQAQADQQALQAAKATARNRQLAIEGNGLEGMSFITGAQSRSGQLDNAALQALADTAGISSASYAAEQSDARDKANVALGQRSELLSLIKENPGAKISFTDTVESAMSKVRDYTKKQEKEAAKKAEEEYNKNLKSTLMQLGISNKTSKGGTMSVKSMEKALTESYKSKADAEKKLASLKLQGAQLDIDKIRKELSSSGGSKDDEKKTDQFFTDIEKQRAVLESARNNKTKNSSAWSTAWKYVSTKYPEFNADEIDSLLGLDYRKYFEGG